jgi:phosphate transport system substrate-binding protein
MPVTNTVHTARRGQGTRRVAPILEEGKSMKLWWNVAMPALVAGVMAAGAPTPASAQGAIKMDGSSTVFPIAEALAEEYQISKRGKVRVTVGIAGTGGGFKKFCRGETDLSNASRPILKEEMETCRAAGIKYLEIPVAFDALTVVVNPQNTWVKTITVADLKKMWEPGAQGRITTWKQVRAEYPAERLMLFGPGADSGTFDYFTEAVNGKAKASRGDYTASEDDNTLVQGVENNKGALGYFGFAYYAAHKDKLRAVSIDGGKGAVAPSLEAVTKGTYNPLSRPLFVYVKEASLQRPEVKEFVKFMLTEGGALVAEVGYLPLPDKAYQLAWQHVESGKLGSVFGGVPEVGVTIDDLLAREGKL